MVGSARRCQRLTVLASIRRRSSKRDYRPNRFRTCIRLRKHLYTAALKERTRSRASERFLEPGAQSLAYASSDHAWPLREAPHTNRFAFAAHIVHREHPSDGCGAHLGDYRQNRGCLEVNSVRPCRIGAHLPPQAVQRVLPNQATKQRRKCTCTRPV